MKLLFERLQDASYRNSAITILSCLFIFIFPAVGFYPLLLLWFVHLCFLFHKNVHHRIRIFYAFMIICVFALLLIDTLWYVSSIVK